MLSIKPEIIPAGSLFLEPFTLKHINKKYIKWLNDPEVVRFSEQRHVVHTRKSCQAYFKACANAAHLFYAIRLNDEKEHIGNITAYVDRYNHIADLAILIGEINYWGKGYGLVAWLALTNFLFQSGIRKITAGTMANNIGMLKIMDRAGMQIEGRRYKHFLHAGKEEDLVFAAIHQT